MMKIARLIVLFCCLLVGNALAGHTPDPMIILQKVSTDMVASLQKNRAELKKNPILVRQLVNKIVVPHAYLAGMSRAVLGRDAWTKATPAERESFQKAFKDVVINTYEYALNAYTNETIKFDPIRGGYEGKTMLSVQSYVIRSDGPPVSLSYNILLKEGQWLLFDLNVEGISMLQSFRSQLASQLASGKSVGQIAKDLEKHSGSR